MLDKHTIKCRRLWENAGDMNVSMLTHIQKKLKLSVLIEESGKSCVGNKNLFLLPTLN
jgi:hypothetical protein